MNWFQRIFHIHIWKKTKTDDLGYYKYYYGSFYDYAKYIYDAKAVTYECVKCNKVKTVKEWKKRG